MAVVDAESGVEADEIVAVTPSTLVVVDGYDVTWPSVLTLVWEGLE